MAVGVLFDVWKTNLRRVARTLDRIFVSTFSKEIGRQLLMYLLSRPFVNDCNHCLLSGSRQLTLTETIIKAL